jgi:hypothetical protein
MQHPGKRFMKPAGFDGVNRNNYFLEKNELARFGRASFSISWASF